MFDCDEMFTSETDESLPASPIYDRYHSGDGYHAVPPLYIGTFMPPKPDLVFHNAPNVNETDHTAFNVSDSKDDSEAEIPHHAPSFVQPTEQVKNLRNRKACFVCKSLTHLIKDCDFYENKMAQTPARNHAQRGDNQQYARTTLPNPQRHVVPSAVLTKSKLILLFAARQVTTVVSPTNVTRPRQAKPVVTKPLSPPRRNINRRLSPKASTFPLNVTAAKVPMVNAAKGNWVWKPIRPCFPQYKCINDPQKGNPQHALKDKGVIDNGCSRHMTGTMSYMSNFEELNSGYVAFGGNTKGGKIFGKGKIKTGKLEFDDIYFVKELKFNLFRVL
nr:ribonuclease H-like domain-containing protein [Tanacetum cinerariifolium]